MPKVTTQKAGKDYPADKITKGQTYYAWQFYTGPVHRSPTYPKPSQLTGSEKKAAALRAYEDLQDAINAATTPEDVRLACEQAASDAQDAIDQYEESISNLEEAFPGGCPNLDQANEDRDAIQEFLDACEEAVSEIEGLDHNDYETKEGIDPEKTAVGWDELTEDGQSEMLDAALELAGNAELSL